MISVVTVLVDYSRRFCLALVKRQKVIQREEGKVVDSHRPLD
jgi:hypothetical protein